MASCSLVVVTTLLSSVTLCVAASQAPAGSAITSHHVTQHHEDDFTAPVHASARLRRQPRSAPSAQPMTAREQSVVVDRHNTLRADEGSSDMQLMYWSEFLASLAASWAAQCNWSYGQPALGQQPQYTSIGQNLFATTARKLNLTAAIQVTRPPTQCSTIHVVKTFFFISQKRDLYVFWKRHVKKVVSKSLSPRPFEMSSHTSLSDHCNSFQLLFVSVAYLGTYKHLSHTVLSCI